MKKNNSNFDGYLDSFVKLKLQESVDDVMFKYYDGSISCGPVYAIKLMAYSDFGWLDDIVGLGATSAAFSYALGYARRAYDIDF